MTDKTSTTSKTIMVVDDDPDFLEQQRAQLEAAGFKVALAPGARQARELLKTFRPDLALVDLMMEQADAGLSLCYAIKKADPKIPIIIITGVTSETGLEFDAATEEERSWVKADAMLTKPVRFEQLRREIERLLKK